MKKLFDEIPRIEGERLVLRKVEESDIATLAELVENDTVYRYLPTFLFERRLDDLSEVLRRMYADLIVNRESLILGIAVRGEGGICGLAEFYGYRAELRKISIGYRLIERYWGRGIASETVALMVDYLYSQTDIDLITASTMVENAASARVLEKNGFIRTARGVDEDWGYELPTIADKWFC